MAGTPVGKRESPSDERRDFGDKRVNASNYDGKNGRTNYARTVRLSSDLSSPPIAISSKDLKKEIEFLVDTGSEANILKIGKADDFLMCNETNKIKLSGITKETVGTYGTCIINVYGYSVEFHIVPDSFPYSHGGIIGSDFFKDRKINFGARLRR